MGDVVLAETGTIVSLEKNSPRFVPHKDVQEMLEIGHLQQVDGEESFRVNSNTINTMA